MPDGAKKEDLWDGRLAESGFEEEVVDDGCEHNWAAVCCWDVEVWEVLMALIGTT